MAVFRTLFVLLIGMKVTNADVVLVANTSGNNKSDVAVRSIIEDQLESEMELEKWIQYVRPLMEIFTAVGDRKKRYPRQLAINDSVLVEEGRARHRPIILQVQMVKPSSSKKHSRYDDYDDYYDDYSAAASSTIARLRLMQERDDSYGGSGGHGGGCCNNFSGLEGLLPLLALLALTGLLFFLIIASTTTTTSAKGTGRRRRSDYEFIEEFEQQQIGT